MVPRMIKESIGWHRVRDMLQRANLLPFLVAGVLSTGTTVGFSWGLSSLLHIDLRLAAVIGYIIGMICSFIFNRLYVFRDGRQQKRVLQTMLFLAVNGVSAAVYAQASHWLDVSLPRLAALILAVTLSMVINYVGYRYIVFAR
jgi:putative flippase GtrA